MMRNTDIMELAGRRPWFAVVLMLICWSTVSGGEAADAVTNDTSFLAEEAPKRRPLVVLRQSTIKGRIFLLVSEEEDSVGSNIKLEVYEKGKEDKVSDSIYKTQTDDEGSFALPNLEVGTYSLHAGKLILELLVEEPEEGPTYSRRIPKTILIFMPAAMRR